jgi:hypothetical protein
MDRKDHFYVAAGPARWHVTRATVAYAAYVPDGTPDSITDVGPVAYVWGGKLAKSIASTSSL